MRCFTATQPPVACCTVHRGREGAVLSGDGSAGDRGSGGGGGSGGMEVVLT